MPLGNPQIRVSWALVTEFTDDTAIPAGTNLVYFYSDFESYRVPRAITIAPVNNEITFTLTGDDVTAYANHNASTQPNPAQYSGSVQVQGPRAGQYIASAWIRRTIDINYPPAFRETTREIAYAVSDARGLANDGRIVVRGIRINDEEEGKCTLALTGTDGTDDDEPRWRISGRNIRVIQPVDRWQVGTYSNTFSCSDPFGADSTVDLTVNIVISADPNNPPTVEPSEIFSVRQGSSETFDLHPTRIHDTTDDRITDIKLVGTGDREVTSLTINNVQLALTAEEGETLTDQLTITAPDSATVADYAFTVRATDSNGATTDSTGWAVRVLEKIKQLKAPSPFTVSYV